MTRIELDLSRDRAQGDSSPVAGSISVDGCPSSKFVGWVELLALMEQALEPPETAPDAFDTKKTPET